MEKMEFSSCDFDCPEKVELSNSDFQNLLVSTAKSEHNFLCQERSDTLPSEVESYNESNRGVLDAVLSIEDNEKNVNIENSVSSNELMLKTNDHTCEILPNKGKQNPMKNDKIVKVNSGNDKSVDSKLIGQNYKSLNIFNSHTSNEENISDQDSISVSSEESSDHDFLVIHESDAAARTFDSSDSLVTCANEEPVKTVKDVSEVLKDEFKKCAIHEDAKVNTDIKHASSEIKERVMSYLNKHSVPCESGIREQECNKMLAMDGTTTNKEAVPGENNSLMRMEEDVALSLNSISLPAPETNDNPIKCDMTSFSSPTEVIVKWDPTEPPLKESMLPLLLHNVDPDVTSHSSGIKLVQPTLSIDVSSQTGNKMNKEMIEGNNSSTEHCIGNNDMELNISGFEETAFITDSVASVTFSGTSMKASASEVCIGLLTRGAPKTIDCNSFSSGTILCDWKEPVNLSDRDHSKCFSSPTFSNIGSNSSDASFINESFQPCYKSGTILTNSSLSSWGKLSFQPSTTSSINSPIFSSKSSNEEKLSDPESLIRCPQFKDSSSGTVKTFALLSQDESKSRKSKSSEALFCTQTFPLCLNSVFRGSIAGKTSLSSLNYIRPPVLAESSWSVNNLNKRTVLGGEKSSSNFSSIDSPLTCNLSIGSLSACGPFKRFPENPFSKKPSESIGIFSSPQETSSAGFPTIFKPVASSVSLSPKREKLSGRISANSKDSMNITFSENIETGLFSFNKTSERQEDKQKNSTIFSFTYCDNLNTAKKFAFNPSSLNKLEKKNAFSSHQHNEHAGYQFLVNPAPFQFQNKNEKSKGSNPHRLTRLVRKSCKQYDRGISNLFKEANMLTTLQVDLSNTPFKPSYGSDVMLDKGGRTKNVMVRYQNIVFMKDHLNVSPEELRAQYYSKIHAIGPFKFCASSEYSKKLCHKKIHSKEVQTDENLISKKYELTEIWRALECPVCLDVVMPPVYQCQQGHHACLTCWNKVVTCPLCKQRKSVTRNYMAEALIDQIPLPCKYHIEGCKETVCRTNKVSHEETCSYRMYQCPVPLCNQAHSYLNMCTHFKKIHKSLLHHEGHSVGKGEKFCDVLYKDHLSSSLIHAFDIAKWGLFFLREHSKRSRSLFIQVMPASPEPAAYFYHLEVSDHHDCRKECYKGRVFCMGKSIQEIIDEEEYLSLSELILKTVKKTAPLKIVVTIWQLKPAFTLSTD